jgi:phytoene synthase
VVTGPRELQQAYASCLQLAQSHYENFPVASRLMPAQLRPHVAAIYAFARIADDYADEPGRSVDERIRLLDEWREKLHNRAPHKGVPYEHEGVPYEAGSANVFLAVHDTINRFDLPVSLLDDLLSAFKQDVTTTRYATWEDVHDYCRRSANPVGRLVLRLSGYRDAELDRASDAVCTALQLTNFWQDLAIDWSRGRLYVPEETWRPHGADPASLDGGRMTPAWMATLRDCGRQTRELFREGRAVCDGVSGRLRYELRATWLGGTRILDRLDQSSFDVFTARPKLGAADAIVIAWGTALWRAAPTPRHS